MRYFKGKQFKKDIILVVALYYCRFSLGYRDISGILNERDISVHPTTLMCLVHEYGTLIYQIWKKVRSVWHLDATYIKVKGEWCYLYRAIDEGGHTLDIQLRKTRDYQAVYMFMKGIVKAFGEPTVLTTDKGPALLCAFEKLLNNCFYKHTKHCTLKHLINRIEQDYRHVKRRFTQPSGFQKHSSYFSYYKRDLKQLRLYINKDGFLHQSLSFRHTRNYNNYLKRHKFYILN